MKKILVIALSLILVLGMFAACDNKEAQTTTVAGNKTLNNAEPDNNSTPNNAEPDNNKTLNTVKPGKLVMATNAEFKPYEYKEGDKFVGIDVEIAQAIADKLGLELEIMDIDFDSIITSVATGSADFGLAGMTVTEKRLQEVDFSITYANGVQAIIVPAGSPITTCDDLFAEGATYKVGVQLGTTGDIYASGDFGADRVVQYKSGNEAVMALKSGDVNCVIIDNEPAKSLVAANEGLQILETEYANEDYAACFKKNNPLLDDVNAAIEELIADGTIDNIIAKYIPAN